MGRGWPCRSLSAEKAQQQRRVYVDLSVGFWLDEQCNDSNKQHGSHIRAVLDLGGELE